MLITKQYDFGYTFGAQEPLGTAPRVPKDFSKAEVDNWLKGYNKSIYDRSISNSVSNSQHFGAWCGKVKTLSSPINLQKDAGVIPTRTKH